MGVSNMLLFMSINTPSPRIERTCLALNSFLDTGSGLHINRSFGKAKTHGELAQLRRHGIGHDVMETRQPPYLRMMIETARDSYFVSQGAKTMSPAHDTMQTHRLRANQRIRRVLICLPLKSPSPFTLGSC